MHFMDSIFIFGLMLVLFGPKKLPELGKGLGESIRGLKSAMAAKQEAKPTAANPDTTIPRPPVGG